MRARKRSEVPSSLSRLERRFTAWRKARGSGQRIPESLWNAAVEMAGKYGLNRTATFLKLDYYSLKKRIELAGSQAVASTFVELPLTPLSATSECVIEWEDAAGARMRVHVKGQNLPDMLALSRSFWNAD